MANISNKRNFRIVVEGVEFSITAVAAKSQAMEDLIFEVGGSAICVNSFILSGEQYVEFANKSIGILAI